MNKTLATTTLIIAALAASSQQMAQAQRDGGTGNRYEFAPNHWKTKDPYVPAYQNYSPPAAPVNVPRNLLGVPSAEELTPPPAPPRSLQQVAPLARPSHIATSFTTAVPQAIPSSVPTAPLKPILPIGKKGEFGQPIQPVVASKPPQPATATPAHGKSNAAKPSKPVYVAHHSLNGRMLHPSVKPGQAAGPAGSLPPIASYSSGYDPGQLLPHMSSGGQGANTNVHAKLVRN